MAVVRIPEKNRSLTEKAAITDYLQGISIDYEIWEPEHPVGPEATQEEILRAYLREIDALKARGGYVTADVISVTPQTPGLDAMLARFSREHWHDEDEVRFIIQGRGLFHIHPKGSPVVAIEVEAAGLCAINCTKADAKNIRHWMEKTNLQFKGLENTKLHYDFDFHLAIAKGTKNPHFYQLLQFLKPIIVRRLKLSAIVKDNSKDDFAHIIQGEHEAIVAAIEARDEQKARRNMRTHLVNSLERVRTLAASLGVQGIGKRGSKLDSILKSFAQTIGSGAEN